MFASDHFYMIYSPLVAPLGLTPMPDQRLAGVIL